MTWATFDQLWDGASMARVEISDLLHSEWRNPGQAVRFMNRAFELYHDAIRSIMRCPSMEQRTEMERRLRSAATHGWGRGVSDLRQSFQHLASQSGGWSDRDTSVYNGGSHKTFTQVVTAPTGPVNFMNAVDLDMASLRQRADWFVRWTGSLADTIQAGEWGGLADTASEFGEWTGYASGLLWFGSEIPVVGTAHEALGRVSTYASLVDRIRGAVSTLAGLRDAGVDHRSATALTAMGVIAEGLPILGGIYGEAMRALPDLVRRYRADFDSRIRRVESVFRDAGYMSERRGLL